MTQAAIFVDGWNVSKTLRDAGLRLDFQKLYDYFTQQHGIIKAFYYTGQDNFGGTEEERTSTRNFLYFLQRVGYHVNVKQPKHLWVPGKEEYKCKANFDVEIAVDMMELATSVKYLTLVTGDGDFTYLLKQLGRKGVFTEVIFLTQSVSHDLLTAGDRFTAIEKLPVFREGITYNVAQLRGTSSGK